MQITLHNFQGHKHTVIDASENITAIVGKSHHGKTSILRGVKFLRFNRPLGDSFIRTGSTECFVSIDGIQHGKGKQNFYDMGDGSENLTALKGAVPVEVQRALNFSEVNIQMQFDPLFLLSSAYTPGTVAQMLSELVDIAEPQEKLKQVRSNGRALSAEYKSTKELLTKVEAEIEGLRWFDAIEKQYNEISGRIAEFNTANKKATTIANAIENAVEAAKNLKNVPNIIPLQKRAAKLLDTMEIADENMHDVKELGRFIDTITTIKGAIPKDCSKLAVKSKFVLTKLKEHESLTSELIDLMESCSYVTTLAAHIKKANEASNLIESANELLEAISETKILQAAAQAAKDSVVLIQNIKVKEKEARSNLDATKQKMGVCPLCGGDF